MRSSPVPLKTRHISNRCTLNLSRVKRPPIGYIIVKETCRSDPKRTNFEKRYVGDLFGYESVREARREVVEQLVHYAAGLCSVEISFIRTHQDLKAQIGRSFCRCSWSPVKVLTSCSSTAMAHLFL
ncbi:hypothetical protein TNCV_3140181 [Trichonephila clavipes]|nr:hypothetical protein TNCV_3140181 [Trichonephila clavipes]